MVSKLRRLRGESHQALQRLACLGTAAEVGAAAVALELPSADSRPRRPPGGGSRRAAGPLRRPLPLPARPHPRGGVFADPRERAGDAAPSHRALVPGRTCRPRSSRNACSTWSTSSNQGRRADQSTRQRGPSLCRLEPHRREEGQGLHRLRCRPASTSPGPAAACCRPTPGRPTTRARWRSPWSAPNANTWPATSRPPTHSSIGPRRRPARAIRIAPGCTSCASGSYQIAGRYDRGLALALEAFRLFGLTCPQSEEEMMAAFAGEAAQVKAHLAGTPHRRARRRPAAHRSRRARGHGRPARRLPALRLQRAVPGDAAVHPAGAQPVPAPRQRAPSPASPTARAP